MTVQSSLEGRSLVTITTHPALRSSGQLGSSARAEFYAGHLATERIVHLTQASFLRDALCGGSVSFDGEPDLAVICDDCDRLGREAGGDPDTWVVTSADTHLELHAAA